jgi:hypothetical protein
LSDKDFKVKNKLVVNGLTGGAGPLVANSNKEIDSVAFISTNQGGTGITTAPSAGQVLYSAGGTTYSPTTLNTLDVKGATYSADAPSSPAVGQIWVESDANSDAFDPNIMRRKSFTATASQTVFTTDYVFIDGYEQVYFNGMLLLRGSDYTTNGATNTVTLAAGAAAGDIVEVVSITNLNSINTATTTTNTFTGNQIINSRIGINTDPLYPLHLTFNSGSDVGNAFYGNFTGAGGTDFRLVRNSTANSQSVRTFRIRGGNDFDSFTSFELGMESNHPLRFMTNNIERMRITADGLIDMGAFSPNHTLTDSTARTYAANTWYTLPGTLSRPSLGGSYFLQIFIQYDEFGWHGYAGAGVIGIVQWKFGYTSPTITIPLDRHAEDSINVSIRPEIGNGTAALSVNFSSSVTVTAGGFVQIKAKRMF